jgi:hypothetical protein
MEFAVTDPLGSRAYGLVLPKPATQNPAIVQFEMVRSHRSMRINDRSLIERAGASRNLPERGSRFKRIYYEIFIFSNDH